MKIFLHSFNDVITNSSEVIYVCANEKSIQLLKELINYFLKKGGSDKTADDLFTFELELDSVIVERILDDMGELQEYALVGEAGKSMSRGELQDKQYEAIRKMVKEGKIDVSNYEWEDSSREDHIIMTPKDNSEEAFDMTERFRNLFEIEAMRDG